MRYIIAVLLLMFTLSISGCDSSSNNTINISKFKEQYKGMKRSSSDASKARKSIFPNMR